MYSIAKCKKITREFEKEYFDESTENCELTPEQQKIVDYVDGHSFGCKQGVVTGLVSLLTSIPNKCFKKGDSRNLKLKAGLILIVMKTGLGIKRGTPVIVLPNKLILKRNMRQPDVYYSDMCREVNIRPATDAEIEEFLK